MAHNIELAQKSKVGEKDMQAQEAKIHRVPPWEWREVKRERGINPALPALIASSKGHGRVGRPPTGRRSTRHDVTSGSANSTRGEAPSVDIAYRLAINSRILLKLLGDCVGTDFPEDRNVWLRPFKYLVAYETEIRQALKDAEVNCDQIDAGSWPSDQADTNQNHNGVSIPGMKPMQDRGEGSTDVAKHVPHVGAMDGSRAKAERDQLRCLVNFMDTDMQDIFDVKRQISNQTLKEIAFEHLWLLYRPGDLVYSMKSPEDSSTYKAYRVLHVTGGRPVLDTSNAVRFNPIDDRNWDEESESEERARDTIRGSSANVTPFIVDCFSIDYDGNRLGPKSIRFAIPTYNDKRKIDTLEAYPSFFHPQSGQIHRAMVARGRRFSQLATGTHKRYSGMTLRESREVWEVAQWWNYVIHAEDVRIIQSCAMLLSVIYLLLLMRYRSDSR